MKIDCDLIESNYLSFVSNTNNCDIINTKNVDNEAGSEIFTEEKQNKMLHDISVDNVSKLQHLYSHSDDKNNIPRIHRVVVSDDHQDSDSQINSYLCDSRIVINIPIAQVKGK